MTFSVDRNNDPPRTGTIFVNDAIVRVDQDGRRARVSLNGSVSSLAGTCPSVTFTVENRSVVTDGSTRFKKDCAGIAEGTGVKIDGEETASGQVYASTVEVR